MTQTATAPATEGATPPKKDRPRMEYLDIAKGFAAMSVVLLHLFSDPVLLGSGAPFHIWQAMPIFLFVAGITGAMGCRKLTGISQNTGFADFVRDCKRYYAALPAKIVALYIPYAAVITLYYMWDGDPLGIAQLCSTLLMGYVGPGGYFVPLIVMHLIFFPLVLALRPRLGNDRNFLFAALLISIGLELAFAFFDVDSTRFAYRIFYFRYLFACCLGAVLADGNPFSKSISFAAVGLSVVYVWATAYLSTPGASPAYYWNLWGIRADDWFFQHYPGFFYTAFLVLAIRKYEQRIPLVGWITTLGKSSYEIFIVQMLFFITLVPWMKKTYGWADLPLLVKMLGFFLCVYGGLAYGKAKVIWKDMKEGK